MSKEIFYVVNNDSTTSIPLEVAGQINQQRKNFQTIVYYKESPALQNEFIRDLINIGAKRSFDVSAWFKIVRLIKLHRPKAIHTHHTFSSLLFFLFGKIFHPDAKLIKTVHTSNYSFRWDQKIINFFIYLMADKILCNSNATMDSFSWVEKKIGSDKTEVVYNGVNISKLKKILNFIENDNLFKPQSGVMIGSVGRLVEVKDYKTLIEAFDNLYQNIDIEMNLLVVGNGKEKNNLKKFVRSTGLKDKVIFTGAVEREMVYKLLRKIDIFVITSLAEGFCNTLVEALAAERAVVCSDIPTLREVGGDAVLFAEPANPESFSRQIERLVMDKELINKMKKKAAKRAEKFTLEACAKRYIANYEIN